MFIPLRQEDPALNEAIAECYENLKQYKANDVEYAKIVKQIGKLNALKNKAIDPNNLLLVGANLVVAFRVLKFEERNVITTKLWSFLSKI